MRSLTSRRFDGCERVFGAVSRTFWSASFKVSRRHFDEFAPADLAQPTLPLRDDSDASLQHALDE